MRTTLASVAAVVGLIAGIAPQVTLADTYTDVAFTGGISPGNANVQPPFSTAGFSGTPGDPITGSFVFDNNLVPGSSSGLTNVPIPSGFAVSSFDLTITAANSTTLNFNLANELSSAQGGLDAQVQYNNGSFAGFAYVSDFAFSGSEYQFSIQGGAISIFQLLNGAPTGNQLLSGFINIGDSALTDATVVAPIPTPLPSSLGLFCMALGGLACGGLWLRRREPAADQPFAFAMQSS
jgi:hypothetical protein